MTPTKPLNTDASRETGAELLSLFPEHSSVSPGGAGEPGPADP
jgi:hypothetical protein